MPQQPYFNDEFGFRQESAVVSQAGGLSVVDNIETSGINSGLAQDNSYVLLQDKAKALFQLTNGNATVKATGDLFLGGKNVFQSIAGDTQLVILGDEHVYRHGDKTEQTGDVDQKTIQATKDAQKIATDIDKKKMETIKNTQGTPVPCPTCSMEVLTDRGQCLLDLVFKLLRFAIPNFPYPLDILQRVLNFLGVPFQSPETVQKLNGGQGCGSPGCKNGTVNSPQEAIQKANKQAADELKSKEKELGEKTKQMGSGGTQVMGPFTGDVALYVGHPEAMNTSPVVALKDHATTPFGFTNKTSPEGSGFIPHTKGNAKKAVYSDCLRLPGNFSLSVNQKFSIKTGSPGIDMLTSGKVQIDGAVTNVVATEGELTLMSNNVTTVKGKNIIIDGNDRSGDTGVRIEAENTMVAGALHVSGDLAVKGAIEMDGGLYCTHITCPGERVATGPAGPAHQVQSGGTWNNPVGGLQASVLDTFDKILKKAGRDVFNVLSLNIANGMAEIKTLLEEAYETVKINTIIDNFGMPTGFGTTYFAAPGLPAGPPLMVNGFAIVVPGQTLPVHTFTHNHLSPGSNHSHDYTSFQGQPVGSNTAARAIRPEPSHVPSPAKATGIGTKPGHKNTGDLCIPCVWPFGGGGPNNRGRDSFYGTTPQNPTTNYVPITSQTFDPNGNLVPLPFLDIGCDPETGETFTFGVSPISAI
jgi:hypothetical protein